MFEKIKSRVLFNKLLGRPDISKAYKMVPETDSWYDTISTVHKSLSEIQKLPHDVLKITSRDNLKLKGIYYPSEGSDTTVICAHGYTSHAEREWAFPGLFYLSLGYNVLIPYQRAHGMSEGKYISFGALEHLDMIDWAKKVNQLIPNGKIIIHGLSMGGGIVLDLCDKQIENVRCLIADAPSNSIEGFFKNVSGEFFKSNAEKIANYTIQKFKKEFGYGVEDFEAIEHISKSYYPILLSAGSNENMEKMFDAFQKANPKNTEIIILPGCNHGNGMYKQTELYQGKIKEFINKHL